MNNEWLYQIRVYFSADFVELYNSNKTSDLKIKLLNILKENKGGNRLNILRRDPKLIK